MNKNIRCYYRIGLLSIIFSVLNMLVTAQTVPSKIIMLPFKEDFEKSKLDTALWTQNVTGENSIQVQSNKAAHGKNALLVRCPVISNKTWAFITTAKIPPLLRQHHFGRAYLFITPQPPVRHTIFIMAGTSGFPNNRYMEVASAQAKWQLTYVDLNPKSSYEDYHWDGAMPVNRWFCLEWEFNDHPNHTAIWVDGEPVFETDFSFKPTGARQDLVGGFTQYDFGFRLWGDALVPFDIYFDDIALDIKRVGLIEPAKP